MATPVQILFNTLKKNTRNGKYSTIEYIVDDVIKISEKLSLSFTDEQIQLFSEKFYSQYVEFSDVLDNLIEEPEDEVESIKKKIAAYQAKLETNPSNRISIMSMISKLRKKLRDLGEEVETVRSPKTELTEEAIRAKIEQLKLDLALAPMQKRKSVQSMISKLRKKLRDMGVEDEVEKTDKPAKITPAQQIGLDEILFDETLKRATFDSSNPVNKNLLLFLVYYVRKVQANVELEDLCKFILKYKKETFVNKLTEITYSDLDNLCEVVQIIITTTLKNVVNGIKATAVLSIDELSTLNLSNLDLKGIKKIAKATTLKKAQTIVEKFSNILDI